MTQREHGRLGRSFGAFHSHLLLLKGTVSSTVTSELGESWEGSPSLWIPRLAQHSKFPYAYLSVVALYLLLGPIV